MASTCIPLSPRRDTHFPSTTSRTKCTPLPSSPQSLPASLRLWTPLPSRGPMIKGVLSHGRLLRVIPLLDRPRRSTECGSDYWRVSIPCTLRDLVCIPYFTPLQRGMYRRRIPVIHLRRIPHLDPTHRNESVRRIRSRTRRQRPATPRTAVPQQRRTGPTRRHHRGCARRAGQRARAVCGCARWKGRFAELALCRG